MNNVYDIPKFWINLDGLKHSSNLNAIESCITRVYCMQGALSFHHWLVDIVQRAVGSPSRHTWIDKLAGDVQIAINGKQTTTFDSADYLPNLMFHREYTYKPSFRYDQTELISSTVSSIVRLWLRFPSDQFSLLQLSLLDIVASNSPSSILFLDKVWEMYARPFATVFNVWNARMAKANIDKSLAEFQEQFHSHPFTDTGSLEHRKLEYLSQLILEWLKKNDLDTNMPMAVSRFW